jgi:hypothetical protein
MKNILKYTLVLAFMTVIFSCENITDLNTNESFPEDVQSIALMPPIQQQMAQGIQFDSRFLGRYIQNFSNTISGNEWDRYGYVPASDAGGEIWRMTYFGIGRNLLEVKNKAEAEQRYDILGFSKVVRAWSWQVATDYHGDVIDFDQVFTERLTFDYSSQERAYAEVVKLLEEGILDLGRTDGSVSQDYFKRGDFIYDGDRSKWIKFAYGILARNMNSQINKSAYNPDKVIEYCNKSLASSNDDALVKFNGTIGADSNFFGPLRDNLTNFRQTDFVIRIMDGTIFTGAIDPRMSRILSPSKGASEVAPASPANPNPALYTFAGNPLNTTLFPTLATNPATISNLWGTFARGSTTTPGRYLFRDKSDFPLMTYSEIQFMKAEAAFIKGDKVIALDAYTKGINASLDFVNKYTIPSIPFPSTNSITAAERTAFLSNATVLPANAADLTLSHIMLQKYIALFGYGFLETWTDMRKYRYDPLVYKTLNTNPAGGLYIDNSGKLPYRVRPRYNSEYVWNFQAIVEIGADQRDYHTKEMWFMQN